MYTNLKRYVIVHNKNTGAAHCILLFAYFRPILFAYYLLILLKYITLTLSSNCSYVSKSIKY